MFHGAPKPTMIHTHVIIRGRVQGVGYRAWTADEAEARGLSGFVRNRRDGSVEALLIGPADTIRDLIAAMRHGPPMAHVESIAEDEAAPDAVRLHTGGGFASLPTV